MFLSPLFGVRSRRFELPNGLSPTVSFGYKADVVYPAVTSHTASAFLNKVRIID